MALAKITAAVNSAKAVIDIVKGAKSIIKKAEIADLLSDVYDKLICAQSDTLSLQSQHDALIKEKNNLSQKLMEFENWQKTESEYELTEICTKTFVYAYKKAADSTQPEHWLCPNCWQSRKKSILQKKYTGKYRCPQCNTEIVDRNEPPDPPTKMRITYT